MPSQSSTESTYPDFCDPIPCLTAGINSVDPVSTSSGSNFADLIDPLLLSLYNPPPPPTQTTVNPADLLLRPVGRGLNSSHTHGPMVYEAGNESTSKRRTFLRRTLSECSTESRVNILPSVPMDIVNRFWVVYSIVHNFSKPSPPSPRIFRDFFECDGRLNRCLLCNYSIKNQTQVIQHIKGLHFDSFQHKCSAKGCSYSSVRPADFKIHVREQHENLGVGHQCAICKKTLKHKRNYVRHVKKHKQAEVNKGQDAYGSQITAPGE